MTLFGSLSSGREWSLGRSSFLTIPALDRRRMIEENISSSNSSPAVDLALDPGTSDAWSSSSLLPTPNATLAKLPRLDPDSGVPGVPRSPVPAPPPKEPRRSWCAAASGV